MADAVRTAQVGPGLFGETSDRKSMRLVSARTVDDVALLIYQPARDA